MKVFVREEEAGGVLPLLDSEKIARFSRIPGGNCLTPLSGFGATNEALVSERLQDLTELPAGTFTETK